MGVAKGMSLIRWTDNEIDLLKNNYQKPIDFLKKKIPNRTEQSLRVKMIYMGLKRQEDRKAIRTERLFML